MKTLTAFLTLAFALPLSAADYHVTLAGNDTTGNGSVGAPWRTVQKGVLNVLPGDTLHLGNGLYPEAVIFTAAASGTAVNRITVDGGDVATVWRLSPKKPYWTFQNIRFAEWPGPTGLIVNGSMSGQGSAVFDLLSGAHFTYVDSCVFDLSGTIYMGAIAWSPQQLGSGLQPTLMPSNCRITNNEITGVKGQIAIGVMGANNLIQFNNVHDIVQSDFIRVWGNGNQFLDNTFLRNLLPDPPETIGFHTDFVQTWGVYGSKNHLFERNLVKDVEGQIGQLVELGAAMGTGEMGGWLFCNNIFANFTNGVSHTLPNMKWYNNIFYRCSSLSGNAVNLGNTNRGSSDGTELINNIFLDCGLLTRDNQGWYGASNNEGYPVVTYTADYNYVGKNGFLPVREDPVRSQFRWHEDNGINGGDPGFFNLTAYDFRLTSSSPLRGQALESNALFTTDFVEAVRGASWDIGPYEYGVDPDPPDPATPDAPSGLVAGVASASRINLVWQDNSDDETGFHIYYSTVSGSGFELLATTGPNVESYAHLDRPHETAYYYKISAYNSAGDSAETAEATATTLSPPQPRAGNSSLMLRR